MVEGLFLRVRLAEPCQQRRQARHHHFARLYDFFVRGFRCCIQRINPLICNHADRQHVYVCVAGDERFVLDSSREVRLSYSPPAR